VTVQAQSVDNTNVAAKFLFNICAKTTTVIVAPAYQQAFQGQKMTLQSWVTGDTDETGTWSILRQPGGGDGTLADTGNRDTVFSATVTGRYTLEYTSHSDQTKNATGIVYVSPNPMPSYAATPNGTQPHECYVDPGLTGGDYEVGSGKTYTTISSTPAIIGVPAGTIMRIWNTDTTGLSPSTYHEYYQVRNSGTPTQPIIVCGVPDALGNLPIIDGANATGQSGISPYAAGYGIMNTEVPGAYGYWQSGPVISYISFTGLHLRNATPNFTYTPPSGGAAQPWIVGASCVDLRAGAYIDMSGNDMDTCTNGFFTSENSNSGWSIITQNITVMGNHIHGSGWAGDSTEHQVYFQSFYGLVEGNRLDNYSTTAQGGNVKWRGVEGLFRYNYLGPGPLRDFDLVENQDANPYVTLEGYLGNPGDTNCDDSFYCLGDTAGANILAAYQESAQKDFVYGNVISSSNSDEYEIHYAEDHDGQMADRDGVLYFYSNTMSNAQVVFDTNSGNGYQPFFPQRIDARNNILWNPGAIAFNRLESIILSATTNLMQTGSFSIATPILGGSYNGGTANGWNAGCDYTCPWPLTNPIDPHLYGLSGANYLSTATQPFDSTTLIPSGGSTAIGAGTTLTGVPSTLPVRWNYNVATSALTPRLYPLTIGAEDQSGSTPTAVTPTFSPGAGTYTSAQTVTISSTTPSAQIYYTTDGTTPTISSQLYSGPISVSASETIRAITVASGLTTSTVGSAIYTIASQSATPTFTPASGTYASQQNVTISTTTPSATIYYTTDGSTPTTRSPVYSGPITVPSGVVNVLAISVASGLSTSPVGAATYTITPLAATPAFSPAAGTYSSTQTVTISTATPSATIHFTTDGTTPTTNSPIYSGAITVAATETVEAIAVASGYTTSTVGSAAYTINTPPAMPALSPSGGTYTTAQTVTISTTTPSATTYYTTNGAAPTTSSPVYSQALTVAATATVKAIAVANNGLASAVAAAVYTIVPPAVTPAFSPAPGTYSSAQTVTISTTTPSATIHFTTDGSTPTASSPLYSGSITVAASETVKAIAVATGYTTSAVGSAAYTINLPAAATPTFSPAGGSYSSAQSVTIGTTTPSATIYYTTNGLTPTTSSAVYAGSITVSSTETVQSIAVASGYSTSVVASASYTISLPAAAPTLSPAGGTYTSAQSVTIGTTTPSATIYYTTNGSTPTTSSAVYSGPVTVSSTETVQAIAVASGYSTSAAGSATYTVNLPAATPTFSPAGGTYTSAQTVNLSASNWSTIYYTTNGSLPTTSSTVYTGSITVSSTETINAIAVASGYSTSAVASASFTIGQLAASPSFSVDVSPASLAIVAGTSGTTTVLVTPQNGFAAETSLTCAGLPSWASCTFSPSTVTPSGSIASSTLTITTTPVQQASRSGSSALFPGSALAISLCCFGWRKRRGLQMLVLAVAILGAGLCTGCGANITSPVQATVSIVAAHGDLAPTTSLTLTLM
jgi:hypothetical protein